MKYINLFEGRRKKTGPQKDDYVIIKFKDEEDEDFIEFLEKNIGKIDFVYGGFRESNYRVLYKNMPEELQRITGYPIIAYDNDIVFYAKTKRDVENYLVAVKYNL